MHYNHIFIIHGTYEKYNPYHKNILVLGTVITLLCLSTDNRILKYNSERGYPEPRSELYFTAPAPVAYAFALSSFAPAAWGGAAP